MEADTIVRLIADGAVVPVVIIAAYALLAYVPKGQRFESYARILMAGLTAYLIAKLLGTVYQPTEQRPFELMGLSAGAAYLNNPGFPSDHALFTGFLTLAVWFETRRKGIVITLAVFTLLVCLGRVLALVHTPLDVVAGLVVAATGTVWYLQRGATVISTSTRAKRKKLVE